MLTAYWAPFRVEAVEARVWVRATLRQVLASSYESAFLLYTDKSISTGF